MNLLTNSFTILFLIISFIMLHLNGYKLTKFSSRKIKKIIRLFSSSINPIQNIYNNLSPLNESEVEAIAVNPESSSVIKECLKSMEKVTLTDIGLSNAVLNKINENICMNIYSCKTFHIAVFIIPTGCSLPLHDHPKVRFIY